MSLLQVTEFSSRYDNICSLGSSCTISIPITSTLSPPIYVYYALDNFFQNHRRFVTSYSFSQLTGALATDTALCKPLDKDASGNIIVPCGLQSNSFFNGSLCFASPNRSCNNCCSVCILHRLIYCQRMHWGFMHTPHW